ncbi:MAG TPA: VanZ family protein [Acetobacteraceae bacterium]|nr:VanZ family protein [Acetobacteraceae bacterium]
MAYAGHSVHEAPARYRSVVPLGGWRYAAWTLLYAVLVVYSSVVVSPAGLHYVPLDPAAAWQKFLATPLLDNGSDQRPDWNANLLLTIPLGFLLTGSLASARGAARRLVGTIVALLLGLSFVLAVKYAQLFFPQRTVSLNYIIAQSLGVCAGALLFHLAQALAPSLTARDDKERLRLLLDLAVVLQVAFALFPFDLVLSSDDLHSRLATLPGDLFRLPWADRSGGLRLVLVAATAASTVPLGMRLALRRDNPAVVRIAAFGTALMIALLLASALVLTAAPSLVTLVCRVLGIVAGTVALRWLASHDLLHGRLVLARLVPVLVPIYLVLLAYVQHLLQPHWQRPDQALAGLVEPRALLPLYYYYIVPKYHAVQSIAAHAVMYAPIGVMAWLRYGDSRRVGWAVGMLAGFVAALVELGRFLQPGGQLDINAIMIAPLAALLALHLSPAVWRLLRSVSAIGLQPAPEYVGRQPPTAAVAELAEAQRALFEQITGQQQHRIAIAPRVIPWPIRGILAIACAVAGAALVARYPLGPGYAAIATLCWIGLVWWRPAIWLVLVPAMLPSVDLAPWTGWLVTSEADIAVLATLAVLLLRDPPTLADLWPRGAANVALMMAAITCLVGLLRGVMLPYAMPGGSDNPYLQPLDSLRLTKPFIELLALLPFLLARHRAHGDTVARFGCGILIGLGLVGVAAIAERAAFVGVFDMHSDYRVAATFSSMHIGGGHIGAFVALALPFLVVCLNRPNVWTILALPVAALLGGYTLVVTFARTAYAAALASVTTSAFGWTMARLRQGQRAAAMASGALPVLVVAAVAAGLFTPYMMTRLNGTARDFATREQNWMFGLALERQDWLSLLFGMGTGTYPRVVAEDSPADAAPGNYVVSRDDGPRYITLMAGSEFYFGQKVPVVPGTDYRLSLDARARAPRATLVVGLCAKLLLYSLDCGGTRLDLGDAGTWMHLSAPLRSPSVSELLPAPVELWLSSSNGRPVDVGRIRLIAPDGKDVVANGDFADGTARWLFTSDRHLSWRIKNLYLATWFEGGLLGLAALATLALVAMAGAARAIAGGNRWGAPVLGGLVAMLISGLFDNVFEAPRLAVLYYMVLVLGLIVGMRPPRPARQTPRTAALAQPSWH